MFSQTMKISQIPIKRFPFLKKQFQIFQEIITATEKLIIKTLHWAEQNNLEANPKETFERLIAEIHQKNYEEQFSENTQKDNQNDKPKVKKYKEQKVDKHLQKLKQLEQQQKAKEFAIRMLKERKLVQEMHEVQLQQIEKTQNQKQRKMDQELKDREIRKLNFRKFKLNKLKEQRESNQAKNLISSRMSTSNSRYVSVPNKRKVQPLFEAMKLKFDKNEQSHINQAKYILKKRQEKYTNDSILNHSKLYQQIKKSSSVRRSQMIKSKKDQMFPNLPLHYQTSFYNQAMQQNEFLAIKNQNEKQQKTTLQKHRKTYSVQIAKDFKPIQSQKLQKQLRKRINKMTSSSRKPTAKKQYIRNKNAPLKLENYFSPIEVQQTTKKQKIVFQKSQRKKQKQYSQKVRKKVLETSKQQIRIRKAQKKVKPIKKVKKIEQEEQIQIKKKQRKTKKIKRNKIYSTKTKQNQNAREWKQLLQDFDEKENNRRQVYKDMLNLAEKIDYKILTKKSIKKKTKKIDLSKKSHKNVTDSDNQLFQSISAKIAMVNKLGDFKK